jgi:2-(1,2-epoxy-1,2-dihydrophenyl)acetyl-CoA isomerase
LAQRANNGTLPEVQISAQGEQNGRCEASQGRRRLAAGPTRALVATRALIEESEHSSYSAQFRRKIEVQADIRGSEEALEGRNAFVEKRAARFSGR